MLVLKIQTKNVVSIYFTQIIKDGSLYQLSKSGISILPLSKLEEMDNT